MRKMRNYRDYLIEKLSDHERAISYLQTTLEEYEKDPDGAALYYGFSAAVEGQGGVQKFALKTHSTPQAVSDALLSKDEIQIAELLKKQVLAKRGEDKDIARNEALPEGWQEVQLGEFMEFKNGLNTRKENYGSGVKFVNVMDVFSHNHLYANDIIGSVQVTKKQRVDYSVKYGDVLFNRTSETFEEIAMASVYLDKKEIIFGGFVIRGRQKTNILIPEYSAYCFQAHTVRRELIRRGQGAVRANIGQKDLSKIPVIIPPVNEQKTIASLLKKWDTVIEKTEAMIDAKEKRFKWLMKVLISDQQDNPEWRKVKLGEILEESQEVDTTSDPTKRLTVRLHLKGVDVREHRGTESENATYYFKRKAGQLIYGKQNIFRGAIGIIPTHLDGYSSSRDIPAFDVSSSVSVDWLYLFLSRSSFYKSLERLSSGSGSKRLHPMELYKIVIRLPPTLHQKQVVRIFDIAQQEIDSLKQLAEQYRTQKRGLMQKLLTGKWRVKEEKISCRI